MSNRLARSTLVVLVIVGAPVPGRAAEPLTPADTTLSDAAIGQRIDFIERRLDSHATHGQIWYWGWMAINGGSMVGRGIGAGLSKHGDDRVNSGVQAGLGAIGVADLLLRPLEARHGAGPIRSLPEGTRDERIAKLRAAESQLGSNAQRAEERTSWKMQAGNVVINGIAGLIIGLAGRTSDGLIAFGTGTAGGVIEILTQPWGPASDWKDYRQQFGGQALRPHLDLYVAALAGGGAQAGVRWLW
jgi:hypothetical protein